VEKLWKNARKQGITRFHVIFQAMFGLFVFPRFFGCFQYPIPVWPGGLEWSEISGYGAWFMQCKPLGIA